jgi:3-hydroxybutyryl-CoA dehydratase
MSGYLRYDEVKVGDEFPNEPVIFVVSEAVVDSFLEATDDKNTLFGKSGDDKRRAPSMLASVYLIDLLTARRNPPGGIHAKQSIQFHQGLTVGDTLSIKGRIAEKYIRKERPYVVSDFEAHNDIGDLVASGRITSIWGKG